MARTERLFLQSVANEIYVYPREHSRGSGSDDSEPGCPEGELCRLADQNDPRAPPSRSTTRLLPRDLSPEPPEE